MAKVFVVGAGHGGLTVAARLQNKGHDVTVYEATDQVVTFEENLTLPAAYRDFFLKTGSALEENLELVEVPTPISISLDTNDWLEIPGSGLGRVLSEIEIKLGRHAAKEWRSYSLAVGQLWQNTRTKLVQAQLTTSLGKTVGWKNVWRYRTVNQTIKSSIKSPELVELAKKYLAKCHVTSDTNFGLITLNSYVEQIFGVYQPAGGFTKLTEALFNRCSTLGVNFEFSATAAPVALNSEIVGLELSGGKLHSADYVVVNDLSDVKMQLNWRSTPSYETKVKGLFVINEHSWLGLGPAHSVLGAEIVANLIGSATN